MSFSRLARVGHTSRKTLLTLAVLSAATLATSVHAATITWDGGAATTNWTDANNWSGVPDNTVPTSSDVAQFNNATPLTVSIGSDQTIQGLVFNPTAANATTTIGGTGKLTLAGGGSATILATTNTNLGIWNASTDATRVVNIGSTGQLIEISGSQTWYGAAASASVTNISGNLTGTGNVTINTSGQLQSTGDGALPSFRLSGNNSAYTGNITIAAQRMGLALMNPNAMIGGNISLTSDRKFLYLSGSSSVSPFTFGIGSGAGQVLFNTSGNSSGGLIHDGNQWLRLGGAGNYSLASSTFYVEGRVTSSLGALTLGNSADKLILSGSFDSNVKTFKVDGSAIVDMQYGLDDTGLAGRTFRKTGSGLLILNTAASGAQTTINGIQTGAVSVSNMNQLFDGNLAIGDNNGGGIFIFNNLSWSDFAADRSSGTGTGANQWRLMGSSSPGFAARGTNVTIDTAQTTASTFDRAFTLGSTVRGADGNQYANANVTISRDITLTAARTWSFSGFNSESTTNWTIVGPVHQITGAVTGNFALTLSGTGGTVRLTNTNNSFSSLNIGNSSLVAIATDDAVLGAGTVTVTAGAQGQAALLLFENQGGGTKVFSRNFTVAIGADASSGEQGFGSYAGNVQYNGNVTITGGRTTAPVHVHSGTLSLSGATITNNSTGATQSYNKGGTGELDLRGVTYAGTNTSYRWTLQSGTIVTGSATQLLSGNNALSWNDMFGNPNLTWKVRDANQTYSGVTGGAGANSGWQNNSVLDVDSGIVLATDFGSNITSGREVGSTVIMRKTGGGTWRYTTTAAGGFGNQNTNLVAVEAGTFEVTGSMGRAGIRLAGGTALINNASPITTEGRAFEITSAGGKLGIATTGSGDVSRTQAITSWDQSGTSTVTFASRDNRNLTLSNAAFPAIAVGTTLAIERDGAGTGQVRLSGINNLSIAGTIKGSGELRLGSSGGTTGTLSLASGGILAPGSSPGVLTVANNVSAGADSIYQWEAKGYNTDANEGTVGIDFDQTVVSAGNITIASGAKLQIRLANGADFTGSFWGADRTWTIFNNTGAGTLTGLYGTGDISIFINGTSFGSGNSVTGEGSFTTEASGNDLLLKWTADLSGGTPAFDISPTTLSLSTLKGAAAVSGNLTLTNNGTLAGNTAVNSLVGPLSNTPTSFNNIGVGGTANTVVSLATGNYASGNQNVNVTQNPGTVTSSTVNYNVGNAQVGPGNTFGTALTGTSTGADLSSITSNTEATAIGIDNGNSLSMDWRSPTVAEAQIVQGDIVRINTVDSDIYVLKLTYSSDVNENQLFLGELVGGLWGTAGNELLFAKQFDFLYDQGAVGLSDDLGRWGIVTTGTGGYVWAVVQGDGTFAAIPEPTSLAMLGLGAAGLLLRRRK